MLRPLSTVVFAASVLAAALALPAQAPAKDADVVQAPPASAASSSSPVITSRAQATTPHVRRIRRVSTQPRRVAVAAPALYYPQCFLFWCSTGGRPFHFLVLGVAY